MTMPHLMNCMHKEDGWCLECVGELNVEAERGRRVKTTPDELAVMKVLLSWFPNMTEESQEHFAIQYRTRAYHGFGHLSFMLKFLRDNSELCTDYVNAVGGMGPIVFAILFHDLVYEPGSKHNEATSALDFRTHAFVHGIDKKIVEMVEYAITNSMQAPQHKIEYPDTELGRKECGSKIVLANLLHDLDFVILAMPPSQYMKYCVGIREEYCDFSDEDFAKGRIEFLKSQLGKRSLFCLPAFTFGYSEAARTNMLNEIYFLSPPDQFEKELKESLTMLQTGGHFALEALVRQHVKL